MVIVRAAIDSPPLPLGHRVVDSGASHQPHELVAAVARDLVVHRIDSSQIRRHRAMDLVGGAQAELVVHASK